MEAGPKEGLVDVNPFEPCSGFQGARPGWAFKRGQRGVGYYGDVPRREPAEAPRVLQQQDGSAAPQEPPGARAAAENEFLPRKRRKPEEPPDSDAPLWPQARAEPAAPLEEAAAGSTPPSMERLPPVKLRAQDRSDAEQAVLAEAHERVLGHVRRMPADSKEEKTLKLHVAVDTVRR